MERYFFGGERDYNMKKDVAVIVVLSVIALGLVAACVVIFGFGVGKSKKVTDFEEIYFTTSPGRGKSTRYIIINEGEEAKASKTRMSYTMQCYKEFGKVENNSDMLRFILFAATGTKSVPTTPLEILQVKVNDLIQADAKAFLRIIADPLRDNKVLIIRASEEGLISKRANFYYIKSGNETIPMCENGEEPTLSIAARWLSHPRRQEMKFNLEDRLNK